MNEKRVVIIATTTLAQNYRASKLVRTLTNNGYLVTFLGLERGVIPAIGQRESNDHLKEILLRLKAPLGIKVLFFYPFWWCFVFFSLMVTKWDVAHAINFDSIPPALIAGKLKGKRVIYEILDGYEDMLPKTLRGIVIKIDKLFMWLANGVILVDEAQIDGVGGIPNSEVTVVYDSPPDSFSNRGIKPRRNDTFILFFGGILFSWKGLNLDKILHAIRDIEGVKIIIAGFGDLVQEIIGWSREMPDKIQFIGEISHDEVLQRSVEADLLFVLRNPIPLTNKYICGSKILEAMMCGKPILVNKGTSTASKVLEENCGLVVDANNIEEIRNAILKLRDNPKLCEELGGNARKAYEQRYSWEIMEQHLIRIYHGTTVETDEQINKVI